MLIATSPNEMKSQVRDVPFLGFQGFIFFHALKRTFKVKAVAFATKHC